MEEQFSEPVQTFFTWLLGLASLLSLVVVIASREPAGLASVAVFALFAVLVWMTRYRVVIDDTDVLIGGPLRRIVPIADIDRVENRSVMIALPTIHTRDGRQYLIRGVTSRWRRAAMAAIEQRLGQPPDG